MADCAILRGGTGAYGSDDLTATKAHVLAGKTAITSDSDDEPGTGTMTNQGAVSPGKLAPGGSYTIPAGYHNGSGKVTAKTRNIKMISAGAIRGFGANSSDWEPSEINSFTIPAGATNCTVYYGGFSADYNGAGSGTCRIYRGAAGSDLVDNRDLTGNTYIWRSTMVNKSFSPAAGETIKVEATVSSGSHVMAFVQAVIEYYT